MFSGFRFCSRLLIIIIVITFGLFVGSTSEGMSVLVGWKLSAFRNGVVCVFFGYIRGFGFY